MSDSERDRPPTPDVTGLLLAWRRGSESAFEELIPIVYEELRRLAHGHLRGERRNHTIQTGELVHETYLRLVGAGGVQWQSRAHFFAVAAQCMRRILVDAARARRSLKRGGDQTRVDLDSVLAMADAPPNMDLVALDEALTALSSVDARRARVVELRFFAGLSAEQAGEVLEVSAETVMRDWKVARAWLFRQLNPATPVP